MALSDDHPVDEESTSCICRKFGQAEKFTMSIEEGGIYLKHLACGKRFAGADPESINMEEIDVTLRLDSNCQGRHCHTRYMYGHCDCDSWFVVEVVKSD